MLGAQLDRRAQAVVGVVGRHPHVDDRDVGLVRADLAHQVVGVARLRDDLEARVLEHAARRPRAAAPSRRRRLPARDVRAHDRCRRPRATRPRAARRAPPAGRPARSGRCRAPGRRRRRRRRAPRRPRGRCGARPRRSRASPARTWRRSSAPRRRRSRRRPRPARAGARRARSRRRRAAARARPARSAPAPGRGRPARPGGCRARARAAPPSALVQLGHRTVEHLLRALRVLAGLVARQPQLEPQGDQPLLRAVVQVALERAGARPGRPRRSARATPRAPRRARAARRPGARSRARARRRRPAASTRPRCSSQRRVVDDRGDAAAVVLDLRDRAPAVAVGQLDRRARRGRRRRCARAASRPARATGRRARVASVSRRSSPLLPTISLTAPDWASRVRSRPYRNANGTVASTTSDTALTIGAGGVAGASSGRRTRATVSDDGRARRSGTAGRAGAARGAGARRQRADEDDARRRSAPRSRAQRVDAEARSPRAASLSADQQRVGRAAVADPRSRRV